MSWCSPPKNERNCEVCHVDRQAKKKKKLDCQCIDEKSANFGKFSVGTSKSQ